MQTETISADRFLEVSADIAYRLSGTAFDARAFHDIIFFDMIEPPSLKDVEALTLGINTIRVGYGDRKRRLGPLSVIHPIRTASILARIGRDPIILDLLAALLHDRDEDLTPERIRSDHPRMLREQDLLAQHLGTGSMGSLEETIRTLTHKKQECSYREYLLRILRSPQPGVLRVKLADRLDNTLDVGVCRHGIPGRGAFGLVFNTLFLPDYREPRVPPTYVLLSQDEGTQMLANLFKNTISTTLIRTHVPSRGILEGPTARLLDGLMLASLRIAQFIVQDSFVRLDPKTLNKVVCEVREYCLEGGLKAFRGRGSQPLDGIFLEDYGGEDAGRRSRLRKMVADQEMFARLGLTFMAIFSAFMSDDDFNIQDSA